MAVRIRLQRHGRKQAPFYHIVVADARAPRDGAFIERIGMYNPMTRPATIDIDRMKAYEWLRAGAQPTDTVHAILRFKGVMFYKHLMRGVAKGAMTQEDAEMKFRDWVDTKEAKIAARVQATAEERKRRAAEISGSVKKVEKKKAAEAPDELLSVNLEEAAAAETADQPEVADAAAETADQPEIADAAETTEETPQE
jgi:small subunit ribosomal protein S16